MDQTIAETKLEIGNTEKGVPNDLESATVKVAVHEFGDETTLHGLRYVIGRGHVLIRLCWLAIVGLAFVLLVIHAKNVSEDFQSSPYSTKIDIVSEVVKTFPAVTVCNDNKLRRSQLYNTKYEGLINIDDGYVAQSDYARDDTAETDDVWEMVSDDYDWEGFYSASTADDFSDFISVVNPTKDELNDYGHTLENFVIQCTYNKQSCNYSEDFTVIQNRHYGNCFTYNFGNGGNREPKVTSKTGALSGLHLSLMVEEDEYMGILAPNRGATIVIHDPNTLPFPEEDGIHLATGSAISVGIREEVIKRLPSFSKCLDGGKISTNFTNAMTNYTVRCCLKICLQQSLLDRCGCVDDIIVDYRQCSVIKKTEMNCVAEVHALYAEDELECNCPPPCRERNYRTSISSAAWPSKRFKNHLVQKFGTIPQIRAILADDELSKSNMIRVLIYFETLNVERVEQMPRYTIPNILGNLGGLMGLFTGMSFISLFEVVFLLLRITKISFSKLLAANQVQSVKV